MIKQPRWTEQTAVSINISKVERDADDNIVYLGIAVKGAAVSDATQWTIYKFERDSDGLYLGHTIAFGAWDNRENLDYE